MKHLFDLSGKAAVITGSTRGIGLAIAEAMVAAGARVVISSRNQDACDAAAAAICDAYGEGSAIAIAASLSDKSALERLVSDTQSRLGKIDVLVCNAATNPYYGPMAGISDEQFRKIFENNVLANHWLTTMVAPGMVERHDGAIIVVSSVGGMIGMNTIGAYNISKAADLQLVRNLAVEHGRSNVRVNAIAPGLIRTEFARALWEDPEARAPWIRDAALGRIGDPEDVAGAAVFLASAAGRHITGQTIVVDGGTSITAGLV